MPKYRFAITVDADLVPLHGGDADRLYVVDCVLAALQRGNLDKLLTQNEYDVRVTATDYNLDPADRHQRLTMFGRKPGA